MEVITICICGRMNCKELDKGIADLLANSTDIDFYTHQDDLSKLIYI